MNFTDYLRLQFIHELLFYMTHICALDKELKALLEMLFFKLPVMTQQMCGNDWSPLFKTS